MTKQSEMPATHRGGSSPKNTRAFGDYVCGGYFIALPARRSRHMNAALLPDVIVSATSCIVELVPNTWSIEWTQDPPVTRREAAAKFALQERELAELTDWSTQAVENGELGWPGVFFELDVALQAKARFLSGAPEVVVMGIALPRALTARFVEEVRGSRYGEPGVLAAIQRGEPPAARGTPLGFDVLGWDCGGFHSYICNGLETEFDSVLGIRPNRRGFFDHFDEARRCAEHCNLETTGAEPGLWLPGLALLYDGKLGE